MPLELESLRKAVHALNEVLLKSGDDEFMGGLDEVARNAIRAGVIQYFEFTYELCWKFMKRWLETNVSPGVARRELFRHGAEHRLISDVEQWMRYHYARNLASQTYEPDVAEDVYRVARIFAPDASLFLEALEERND